MARMKWCFTLHDYTIADEERIQNDLTNIMYLVYGREECPTTGRKHLQGYIHFKTAKRLSGVKQLIGNTAHCEPIKGTPEQNKIYCTKSGNVFEYGELSPRRGLSGVVEEIRKGTAIIDIAKEYTEEFIKFHRGIEACCSILGNECERNWKTKVSVLPRKNLNSYKLPHCGARGKFDKLTLNEGKAMCIYRTYWNRKVENCSRKNRRKKNILQASWKMVGWIQCS